LPSSRVILSLSFRAVEVLTKRAASKARWRREEEGEGNFMFIVCRFNRCY